MQQDLPRPPLGRLLPRAAPHHQRQIDQDQADLDVFFEMSVKLLGFRVRVGAEKSNFMKEEIQKILNLTVLYTSVFFRDFVEEVHAVYR